MPRNGNDVTVGMKAMSTIRLIVGPTFFFENCAIDVKAQRINPKAPIKKQMVAKVSPDRKIESRNERMPINSIIPKMTMKMPKKIAIDL